MSENIMEFLQPYNDLDKLCCKIFNVKTGGITAYINEMEEKNFKGSLVVESWSHDLKKLKHYRYMRNNLVHERNAYDFDRFLSEDIDWIKNFRDMILNTNDDLSLLRKYEEQSTNNSHNTKQSNEDNINVSRKNTYENCEMPPHKSLWQRFSEFIHRLFE